MLVDYRRSGNIRSKTDALDALLLARYGEERHPPAWYPLPEEIGHLHNLLASRDDFLQMCVQETNRLKAGRLDAEAQSSRRAACGTLERLAKRAGNAYPSARPSLRDACLAVAASANHSWHRLVCGGTFARPSRRYPPLSQRGSRRLAGGLERPGARIRTHGAPSSAH